MLFQSRQSAKLDELSGWPARLYAFVLLAVAIHTWIKNGLGHLLPKRRFAPYTLPAEHPRTALGQGEPLRVLVVDSTGCGQGLSFLTSQNNVLIADFASNGQEALDACRKVAYDLLFMDLQGSAMQEIAKIRRDSSDRQIRIVGVTHERLDEKVWSTGDLDGYLRKPLNTSEVRKQMHIKMTLKIKSMAVGSKASYRIPS